MSDPRTDLPAPGAPNFNQRLREVIQTYLGRQGNPLDRGLTIRDLVDTGVLKLRSGFQLKPGAGSSIPLEPGDGVVDTYEPDLTPPPTPGNMTVTASISHVMIEHEAPIYRQGHGHLRTRVYGKVVNAGEQLPTFADAAEIGQFSGTIYAQPSNPATTWRLWIKWETVDGVLSVDPAGGTNGLEATTGQDVALLLKALEGEITESQLYTDLGNRINLIDGYAPGSVNARILNEANTRANALLDEAAARGAAITSEAAARGAAITSEATARADADSALASSITTLGAAVTTGDSQLAAAIQSEATARAGADSAEASARETLAARVTTAEGAITTAQSAITSEATARADADSALASSITTLGATVNSNNTTLSAAIQDEATARANADAAVARSVSTLQASAGTGGLVYNGSFANGSAEGWSGLAGVSSAPYGGLPKAYAGIQNTRDINFPNTDASRWMACKHGDEFEVSAWVSAQAASPRYGIGIQYERTNGNIETWTLLDTVTAPTLAKFLRGYWTAPSDARRVRFWGQIDTIGTENPWHITDVQLRRTDARTSANTAAIQTEAEVRATQTGELYAKYGIKLDVNGYVTGWAMNNNGSTGDMIVLADRFAVGAPGGGNITPFVVSTTEQVINGVTVPAGTYMDAAYIQNGTITNAKIANLAVDSAKIASVSADKVTAGSIAVGQYIQSAGYVAGSAGWRINGDGAAEFSNVTVRGTVYATAGQFAGILLGGSAESYSSGSGFYAGLDGTTYKWRVGNPAGSRIQWTGSSIEVYNSDNQLTISSGGVVGLSDKLDKASNTILNVATSGTTYVAGLRVGNLAWDSSGNRTSGKGIALTPKGILGHNGSKVTFSVDADTGDAFFGGSLEVGAVSASSLYAYQSDTTSLLSKTGFGFTLPLATSYKWNGGKIVLAFRVMIATGRLSGVAWIKPYAAIYVNGNTAYSDYELGNLPAPPSSNAISFSYVTVDSQMLEFNSAGTNNSLSAYINVDFYSSSGAVVANTADVSAFVNAEVSILEVKV